MDDVCSLLSHISADDGLEGSAAVCLCRFHVCLFTRCKGPFCHKVMFNVVLDRILSLVSLCLRLLQKLTLLCRKWKQPCSCCRKGFAMLFVEFNFTLKKQNTTNLNKNAGCMFTAASHISSCGSLEHETSTGQVKDLSFNSWKSFLTGRMCYWCACFIIL